VLFVGARGQRRAWDAIEKKGKFIKIIMLVGLVTLRPRQ